MKLFLHAWLRPHFIVCDKLDLLKFSLIVFVCNYAPCSQRSPLFEILLKAHMKKKI